MEKPNPFKKVSEKGAEKEWEPKNKVVETKKDETTFKDKASSFMQEKAENLKEISELEKKEDFIEVKEEVQTSLGSNMVFLIFAPIIGFVTGPALFLFAIDIEEDQFAIMKIALIGNLIGLILTVIIAVVVFKDGIRKTMLSVYRHFFTKEKMANMKSEYDQEKTDELKAENKTLKESNEAMKKELYEFRLEKEVQKRTKKNRDPH